jgi:hypothetical protein
MRHEHEHCGMLFPCCSHQCVAPGFALTAGDKCKVPCIDVHTPSARLIEQLPREAVNMTHDGVHWSRGMNVVFAQRLLRTIQQSRAATL